MTDDKTLVARLYDRVLYGDARLYWPQGHDPLSMEAAERIEALEEALRWIKYMPLPAPTLDDPAHNMRTIATRALGDGQ